MDNVHNIGAADNYGAQVKSKTGLIGGAAIQGRWDVVCKDKDGNVKWTDVIENLVTNAGLDYLLDIGLSGGSQITSWYVGLTDGTPTPAAADTLASHSGWTEVTDYDEESRVAWVDGGVSNQSVSNSGSGAEFTIDDTVTVGGAFLASAASGTSGTLYAVGAFSGGDKSLGDDDVLTVTATFTAAAA